MKHIKRIISIILVLATFVGSFVDSNYLFSKGTYDFESENVAVFDESLSSFYLQKADRNIIFRVHCEEGATINYALVDSKDNAVSTKAQKTLNGSYDILPPSNGYVAGEKYTLTLSDGVSFESEDLKDARSLVFSIEKEAIEHYEFTDSVVEVNESIGEVVDNTLDVENLNLTTGDIIFGPLIA